MIPAPSVFTGEVYMVLLMLTALKAACMAFPAFSAIKAPLQRAKTEGPAPEMLLPKAPCANAAAFTA